MSLWQSVNWFVYCMSFLPSVLDVIYFYAVCSMLGLLRLMRSVAFVFSLFLQVNGQPIPCFRSVKSHSTVAPLPLARLACMSCRKREYKLVCITW